MNVRKFCAPSVEEALVRIRREMGPDAVILSTRAGEPARGGVEVEVAIEHSGVAAGLSAERSKALRPGAARPENSKGGTSTIYDRLVRLDVDETLAASIAQHVDRHPDPEAGLSELLRRLVKTSVTNEETFVTVLTGGTGVGKTTTLAKLAAGPLSQGGRKPALITCDTWRIAALEQLAMFADILEVPFAAAYTPEELAYEVRSHRERGFHVLVDTPGLSVRDRAGLDLLNRFLSSLPERTTHLVVPASVRARDVESLWRACEPLGVDRLIFSKLDETASYGSVLNVLAKARRPVSWVTFGQNVPQDLARAHDLDLARLILDGELDVRFDKKTA